MRTFSLLVVMLNLGEIESHPVVCGLTEHDALCSPASLGVFHLGSDVIGVARPGQNPVVSPSLIQHSLSAGDVDSCACTVCHQVIDECLGFFLMLLQASVL